MFKLDGKVALVTGGSRGIGRACCEALAEHGATVVVNYVKGEAQAKEVADAITAKGGKAEIVGFDVADAKAAEAAVEEVAKRHGRLDILVANAGISIDGLLLRLKDEDVDRLYQVNVRGSLACAKAATKAMMRARTGRVIFLSSVVGEMGNVGQTAYAATKAAVLKELAARRSFVHVATHGFFAAGAEPKRVPGDGLGRLRFDQTTADRYPSLRSGLVLAGANAPPNGKLEECLLTALEVSELNLSGTELVMLSACVSGRGTAVEGEGVLGLQRAFGVAGARSVVASLWEVPDKATRLLTEEFYRQLWSAPVSRAEALRRAQLRVLGATRDPKTGELRAGETEPEEPRPVVPEPRQGAGMPPLFWAAFVLSDDWR